MKSSLLTSFACMLIFGLLVPNTGLSQKPIWKKVDSNSTLTIHDDKSGKEYKAEIEAVVINHEEQYWAASVQEKGESSYMLGLTMKSEMTKFLTEEEYLNIVVVDLERVKYKLSDVKITSVESKKGSIYLTLLSEDITKIK